MKIYFLVAFCFVEIFGSISLIQQANKTSDDVLSRNKRFLVFVPNGGTLKFVTGYLGPVDTEKFMFLNALRNFQYQYDLPQKWITNPPSFPGLNRAEGREFSDRSEVKYKSDSSREIAYEIVEATLTKEGKNGRDCILRTICEVAEAPVHHNGLVGELIQIFFTPGEHEKIHQDYRDARKAGLNRVNCEKLFPACPFGHGVLDSVSLIQEFKFQDWLNL